MTSRNPSLSFCPQHKLRKLLQYRHSIRAILHPDLNMMHDSIYIYVR